MTNCAPRLRYTPLPEPMSALLPVMVPPFMMKFDAWSTFTPAPGERLVLPDISPPSSSVAVEGVPLA